MGDLASYLDRGVLRGVHGLLRDLFRLVFPILVVEFEILLLRVGLSIFRVRRLEIGVPFHVVRRVGRVERHEGMLVVYFLWGINLLHRGF